MNYHVFTWTGNIIARDCPHHHIIYSLSTNLCIPAKLPSQEPLTDSPLQGPTGSTGVITLPDISNSDTALNDLPVIPLTVLNDIAQTHIEDLVILHHPVGDPGAQVVVLVNTAEAEPSGFSDQTKNMKCENCYCEMLYCNNILTDLNGRLSQLIGLI